LQQAPHIAAVHLDGSPRDVGGPLRSQEDHQGRQLLSQTLPSIVQGPAGADVVDSDPQLSSPVLPQDLLQGQAINDLGRSEA
jgi:hypothetical protein